MSRITVRGNVYPDDARSIQTCSAPQISEAIDASTIEAAMAEFMRRHPRAENVLVSGMDHTRVEWAALTGAVPDADAHFKDDD